MSLPTDLDQIRQDVWLLIHHTQGLVLRCEENAYYREADISYQQFLVLQRIQLGEGPVKETDISKYLGRNLNSISMIVDRMVKQKLITKVRDRKDRRVVHVKLTPLGKERLEAGIKAGNALIKRMTKTFTPEEIEAAVYLLEKLRVISLEELGKEETTPLVRESNIRILVESVKKPKEEEKPAGDERPKRRKGLPYSRTKRTIKGS
jgi:MarR family transcriptional regulator, organic hydroperoxide resistance regulator